MPRPSAGYLAAIGISVFVVAGVAVAVTSEPDVSGLAETSPLKRFGATYPIKMPPPGSDGPLAGCVSCHSVEEGGPHRYAPNLYGIVGADKARASWFGYSQALAAAPGTWTESDLESYLTKPSRFLPGTTKTIVGIADAKHRKEIIEALR